MIKRCFLFVILILSLETLCAHNDLKMSSPNGKLVFSLFSSKTDLSYCIAYNQQPVILRSELGITGWENGLEIEKVEDDFVDRVWNPVYGERAVVRDLYNQKTYILKKDGTSNRLHLIVRAYNSGIAFRYHYEEPIRIFVLILRIPLL